MLWAERLGRFEIDMALEQLQFAPVMTPRTLEELARILREGGRRDVAKIVSDLIPVVQGVVDNFFKPMSQARNEKAFWEDFDTFSREFEPYRLYRAVWDTACEVTRRDFGNPWLALRVRGRVQ